MNKAFFVLKAIFVLGVYLIVSPQQAKAANGISLVELYTSGGLTFINFTPPPLLANKTLDELVIDETPKIFVNPDKEATSVAEIIEIAPTPTAKSIMATPKAINTEKIIVTPSPRATLTPIPKVVVKNNLGGLNADKIFDLVNAHRKKVGLGELVKDERSCNLAMERAPEIDQEIVGGYMHRGLKNRNLGYWNSENIISMRSEEEALTWWLNDYIHKKQIEGEYKYSCVACNGYACVQEFTNFVSKS